MGTIAVAMRATMLDGIETFMVSGSGQATFTVYQFNTALCVFNLGASSTGAPFGSGTSDTLALSNTLDAPVSNTGTSVAGKANKFIIVNQNSATAYSGTIGGSGSGADIVLPSLTVTAATTQYLNSFSFRMAASGLITVEASLTLV